MEDNREQADNWQAAIENVLRMHPGVREAAVVHDEGAGLVAFVVPDDAYVDDVLGRRDAWAAVLGKWRKTFDLSQLTKEASSASVGFNAIGWNSSYTRQPIPVEEIREWVETTIGDILQLAPRSVYEIGCGTGMLLMRIAPNCKRYVAADFSPVVLGRLREQLQAVPSVAERVEVMERRADDFDGLDESAFDTVMINSVAQYFPNVTYLTRVLEGAINIVRPGGHVYVGDVRSLPLLPAFASSVELFQSADEIEAEELRDRIRMRVERGQELVLSPAYFLSLLQRFPKLSRVDIRPRRGRADNEMSLYRYNAILHVGHGTEGSSEVGFQDWSEHELTADEIRSMLLGRSEALGIQRIRNARLDKNLIMLERLKIADATLAVRELRRGIDRCDAHGIHPQDLIDLDAEDLGFKVLLSWSACRADGSYDAVFIPSQPFQGRSYLAVNWPQPRPSDFVQFANSPGQGKFRAELVNRILEHCRESLPAEMAPRDVSLVDMLPRAVDGTVVSEGLLAAGPIRF